MRRPEPRAALWRPRRRSGGSGVLLALAMVSLLLAGCSAGQQAQTATEQPTNDEASANVGSLSLLDIAIAYPSGGSYARGDDARLDMVITNNDVVTPDALVKVRTDAAAGVTISPAAAATPAHGLADASAEVEIPPDSAVSFRGSRPSVTLAGLTRPMLPGEVVQVTFVFAKAGAVTVTVAVAAPTSPVPPAPTAEPSTTPGAGTAGSVA